MRLGPLSALAGVFASALLACTMLLGAGASVQAQVATQFLTADDVGRVIAQSAAEAQARGRPATIAVVDRVGNVLGVFRMTAANNADPGIDNPASCRMLGVPPIAPTATQRTVSVVRNPSGPNDTGLNCVDFVPDTLAAIAKAVTGAYLSSQGNAFTTRTAGQIIQNHFNPGEENTPSGPLYGVQFSQLPCSDVSTQFSAGANLTAGPKRSPLGLAADPGGLPLYKAGVLVGGVGAIADGAYGIDVDIFDRDVDDDELIAIAGAAGFEAPTDISGRITVDGKFLRYTDANASALRSTPGAAPSFASINGALGSLPAVPGYFGGTSLLAGQAYNASASGIRLEASGVFGTAPAYVLVDQNDQPRFPPSAGLGLGAADLTAIEVATIVRRGLEVAYSARAQIRRPLGSFVQVSITVVDSTGRILALARTPDAPVFGIDVSVQKARSAAFLSSSSAASLLAARDSLRVQPLESPVSPYLDAARALLGPSAFADGRAYSDRSIANISRSTFPDGIGSGTAGPFARSLADTNAFSTGLQLDLVFYDIAAHILYVRGNVAGDVATGCTRIPAAVGTRPLANGLQIFPGAFPIYRGGTLIGAVGASGDGIDQDDMVTFLGLARAAAELNTGFGHAPPAMRADQLTPSGTRLRYVNCPYAPVLGQSSRNVCQGI